MLLIFIFLLSNLVVSKQIVSSYFAFFDDAYNATMNTSKTIPWKMFDRILIAFAMLDEKGNLTNSLVTDDAKIRRIISLYRKSRPDGEILISIYGDDSVNERYIYASNHTEIFTKSVLKYLKKYQINGLDVDWETFAINAYSTELVNLLKSCYNAFGKKYKITHTIWPRIHSPDTVGLLANVVDEINIMSYGTDVNDIEYLINQYNQSGFPYRKMIIGMDTESESETKDSITAKMELIKKYGVKGPYLWRLDNDGIPRKNGVPIGPPTFKTTKLLYDVLFNHS